MKIGGEAVSSGAMSTAVFPADHELGAGGLVEMERELTRLLIEYDELRTAWPKGRHVLVRAKIGRQAADALARIADLQNAISTKPARTLASNAASFDGDIPVRPADTISRNLLDNR